MSSATLELTGTTEVSRRDRAFGATSALFGLLSLWLFAVDGTSQLQFTLRNAGIQLDPLELPTTPTVVVLALSMLLVGGYQALRGTHGRPVAFLGAGIALFIIAFLVWSGSFRSINVAFLLSATVRAATPLALGALAGVMCEKSGIINIGIEAQLLAGAFVAAVGSSLAGPWVGLLAAMAGSLVIGMILVVLSVRYRADQIIVGVVLIVFASGLTAFLVAELDSSLNSPRRFGAMTIPGLVDIPLVGPMLFGQSPVTYMMLASVAVVTFLLYQTRWGLRVRAVGEKPKAADTVGVSVHGIRYAAVAVGSLFAGIGGGYYTLDSALQFSSDMTAGAGFIALAAVLVGRHNPVGAFLASLLFGFATAVATVVATAGVPISSEILQTTPYVVTLFVVAGIVGRIRVPAAGGQPYVKE